MSLSKPRQSNPVTIFIEWSGSKGKFYYYDKIEKQNILFDETVYIVPLDELCVIKGYHDASNSGIYSNEVRNTTKEKLIVKAFKGGLIASGLYGDIKGQLEGGKYGKSVYAANISEDGKDLTLVNFQFHGSSLGSWIDAKINVDNGNVISLSPSTEELKKGTTIYFAPKIKKHEVRQDILKKCVDMDAELQVYLNNYLNTKEEEKEQITDSKATEATEPEENDDLPF